MLEQSADCVRFNTYPPTHPTVAYIEKDDCESPSNGASAHNIKHILSSSGFHYLHDDPPTDLSPVPLALRWLAVSDALHTHVDPSGPQPKGSDGKTLDDLEVQRAGKPGGVTIDPGNQN